MKKFTHIYIGLFWMFTTMIMNAQSYTAGDLVNLKVEEFSLIATNNAPINLNLTTNVAGSAVSSVSNSDMYVRVSSIVPGNTHRELTVRIANGSVPAGTQLSLISAPCTTTNSGGKLGIPSTTPVVLSSLDQLLVDYIGNCYTGTAYNDGYRLTYTWSLSDPAVSYNQVQAMAEPVSVTVVLTITAHNSN